MRRLTLAGFAAVVAATAPLPGAAQSTPAGIRGDIIGQLDDAASKLAQLAEALPADKYGWRPAPGVRSVSEVFMHVTGANYFFPRFVGVQATSPLPPDADKITDKAVIVKHMQQSFEYARGVIRGVADADLGKPTDMFGRKTTYGNALLLFVTHSHEHLGQMIAYARMNGVAPPWSMARN
jgi:uncharacterized damage-inducible protein DinB